MKSLYRVTAERDPRHKIPVITLECTPEEALTLLSGLDERLIDEYKNLWEQGAAEAGDQYRNNSLVLVHKGDAWSSSIMLAMIKLYKVVSLHKGTMVVAGYPREGLPMLNAIGITSLPRFRLTGDRDKALRIAAGIPSLRSYLYRAFARVSGVNKNEAAVAMAADGRTNAMKAWIEAGANVSNETLLEMAAGEGQTKTVKALLADGADVHTGADFPLWVAAREGHTETVRLLLEAGADTRVQKEALGVAVDYGHTETAAVLASWMGQGQYVSAREWGSSPTMQPGMK